jgi:hypothetical protein
MTIKAQYEVRRPRIMKIVERTKRNADKKRDMSLAEEFATYFFMWLMGKIPSLQKTMIGDIDYELSYGDMDKLIEIAVGKQLS